jgi:homoserine kinase
LAAAAAAAAGATDPLAVAASVDGHPDNAAASVLGGLVTATLLGPRPFAARLPLDSELAFVVLVPQRGLATAKARQSLPASVPHHDAAFNLGRMGMLLTGLADHRRLVWEATEDRLHQTARTPLFPEAPALLAGLVEAGALASCWSGAGPSLLGICWEDRAQEVRTAGERLMRETGVPGRALLLAADTTGLTVDGDPVATHRPG